MVNLPLQKKDQKNVLASEDLEVTQQLMPHAVAYLDIVSKTKI